MEDCEYTDQLLILTNSIDATVDVLLDYLPQRKDAVFRLNFDLIDHYQFVITPEGFEISDPTGRFITLETTRKAYYRKPGPLEKKPGEEGYRQEELWQAFRALTKLLWRNDRFVLVEPNCEQNRLDKLSQTAIAKRYFPVPTTCFCFGRESPLDASDLAVVKALTLRTMQEGSGIYTSRIRPKDLDRTFSWFIQDYVAARFDLTVVYVRGKIFSFSLERSFLDWTADWRESRTRQDMSQPTPWKHVALPAKVTESIHGLMKAFGLAYGRIDFLWDGEDDPVFCEINPNGQFAWLDLSNSLGLIDAIVTEISPDTPKYPISFNPYRIMSPMTQH